MLIRHSVPGFSNRVYVSLASLFVPLFDAMLPKHNNVLAVLSGEEGKLLVPASNIVTNYGDLFYAQKGAGEATTNAFTTMELASAGNPQKASEFDDFTIIGSTSKVVTLGYPKTNDVDADNTGAGTAIVTYLFSYGKADFNAAAISHGLITVAGPVLSPPSPILTGFAFGAPFAKTANDTLKVFVNHQMLGV